MDYGLSKHTRYKILEIMALAAKLDNASNNAVSINYDDTILEVKMQGCDIDGKYSYYMYKKLPYRTATDEDFEEFKEFIITGAKKMNLIY